MSGHRVFSVEDKVILITGSGRGIGRALALGFAEAGARLAINVSTHLDEGQATVAAVEELGAEAILIQADVADKAAVERMMDLILGTYGRLDVLINNAGVGGGNPAEDLDMDTWDRVLGVNLTGTYLCCGAAARKAMIPQQSGRIVNISSIDAFIGDPDMQQVTYHVSKGGVNILTRTLALEWVKHNITINAICPGWIGTEFNNAFFAENSAKLNVVIRDTPMHRLGKPDELVGAAIFLASDAASFMTGQTVVIDGGFTSW
jgi:NAD(P)-dependent dehydrogenase (short-subunit alcohol dehydrogenase family)